MGFAFAICNFFGGENKRSQGCSNNHRGRQLADWSAPLSIIPVTFTAPPTNAQRRRSFHNIPSICGSSAAVGEERRGKKESTSSDTAGEVRRTETERGAPREANGLWSKRRTSKRTSDLRRGLCNCPWVFLFFFPLSKVIFAQFRHVFDRQRQQRCPTRQLRGTLSFGEDAGERTDRLVGTARSPRPPFPNYTIYCGSAPRSLEIWLQVINI